MASLSVVSLTEACHFYCQTLGNLFADDKLFVEYIQNSVERQQQVCFKKSKRGISVTCLQPGGQLKLAYTEFSPDYCNRNNSLSISNSI